MANITGWGRGTWGEGAWNEASPVRVGIENLGWGEEAFGDNAWGGVKSTMPAATGSVGTAVVREDILVSVTGLEATSAVGSVEARVNSNIPATGLEATSAVGSVSLVTDQVVSVPVFDE